MSCVDEFQGREIDLRHITVLYIQAQRSLIAVCGPLVFFIASQSLAAAAAGARNLASVALSHKIGSYSLATEV